MSIVNLSSCALANDIAPEQLKDRLAQMLLRLHDEDREELLRAYRRDN